MVLWYNFFGRCSVLKCSAGVYVLLLYFLTLCSADLSNLWQKEGVKFGMFWLRFDQSAGWFICTALVMIYLVVQFGWSMQKCGSVCSDICMYLGGADLCYAGGDVGYDAPTSYAYVQGEQFCEMLKHSIPHPINVYFPDHLRRSSYFVFRCCMPF